MRTSRIAQDTARVFNTLSSNGLSQRSTRSAKSIASFALDHDGSIDVEEKQIALSEQQSETGSNIAPDIEEALDDSAPHRPAKRRKLHREPAAKTIVTTITDRTSTWVSPRKQAVYADGNADAQPASPGGRMKAKVKVPARKTTTQDGTITIHPPTNWDQIYSIIHDMRRKNPVAPVDTMGCEDLFWQSAPPKEKRYHTLTALMLSSQTKDTVTAAAMQRLHTELVPQSPDPATGKIVTSGLTVENILACDAKWLDELIGKVGFHNNKTRYIKSAAQILREEYAFDIPNTIEGLLKLPGVGPKMAYLCMSAAWGIDEGIGVDVHVHRITNLWGWHNTKTPEETRYWLEGWLPKEKWHEINKMLVGLGQTICLPVGRRCGECDLAGTGLCKGEVRGVKMKERRVKVEKMEGSDGQKAKTLLKEEAEVDIKEELVGNS